MSNVFSGFLNPSLGDGQGRPRKTRRSPSWTQTGSTPLPGATTVLTEQRLALILQQVEQTLFFAAHGGALQLALQQALGVSSTAGDGLELLNAWKVRQAPRGTWALPSIQLVSSEVLPAQRGAYVADLNTILLNRQWLATATNAEVMAVLIEEYGHRLDHLFNPSDTPGDEGARFKDLVLGTPAAPGDYADDQFEVVVGGRTFLAEAASGLTTTLTGSGAFTGTPDNDTITGTAANDTIDGGSGDDLIAGLGSNDSLLGGSGNDTLRGGAGNDTINGGAGFDLLDLSDAAGPLTFTFSNNSATAATVSDTATGGIGTDSYTLMEGVIGGRGNDRITGSTSGDLLAGGDGNDTLNGAAGNDTLRGGGGNDVLDGGAGIDLLDLSDAKGNLSIDLSNNSTIPGSVSDGITGSSGAIGKDTYTNIEGVIGGSGADSLTGSGLADLLAGGGGIDNLLGGAGNDTLRGGSGDDVIDGGSEIDILDLSDATAALNLSFTPGAGSLDLRASGLGTDRYSNIEGLLGSNFNDVLVAGAASSLLGGDGNDTLIGSAGNDTLIGGAGIDLLDFSTLTSRLTFTFASLGNTTFAGGAGIGTDFYSQIEGLIAGSGADSLTGSSVGDLLAGGAGNDTLRGGGGNDTLRGGSGDDSVDGGAGIDILDFSEARGSFSIALSNNSTIPSSVSDTSSGGLGSDSYTNIEGVFTGAGNDTLVGSVNADWLRGGDGNDVLRQSPRGQANTSAAGDTLEGGLGNDEYQLTSNSSATVINDIGGADILFYMPVTRGTFVAGPSIQGVDTISLDPYGTISGSGLTGDALNNMLVGSLGSDILSGGGGNDTISGSGGNDTINGGLGTDTILVTQPNPTLVSNAPISMDMNGDGTITYVGRSLSRADFNFSDDKKSERTAWVANGDGILAIDLRGDRRINQKNEIAFTSYDSSCKTDLEGLRRAFDTNKNGFLDAGDQKFSKFGVWVDNNLRGGFGDGVCQTGEFRYLHELGITQIKLTPNAVITPYTVAEADNDVTVFGQTQFTINGTQRLAEDVRFATRLPSDAMVVNANDFSSESDIILASGFIQKGKDLNTTEIKVWASTIPGGLGEEVPLNQGYNFVYVIPDGWLLYFGTDTENYNRGDNAPYFISVIPPSAFGVAATASISPAQKLDLENRIKAAIQALPANLQTTSPAANGAAPPANFAPDIRNNISTDPSTPSWSNALVTVAGGSEDSPSASGRLNAIDLNTQDEVLVVVDAVSPLWTQRTGTTAIPSPLSLGSLRSMLEVRDIFGNRNPTALSADPFLGSNLNWTFNQLDTGVTNPYGSSNSFDWLAAGESIALTYTIKVTDNSTTSPPLLSDTQQVRITINGLNDGPSITSNDQAGGVMEDSSVDGFGQLRTDGTIVFSDLDLTDTHTASFVLKFSDASVDLPGFGEGLGPAVANIGSFALTAVNENNADTIPSGSLGWSYTLANNDAILQSLAAGQTLTQVYTVTVSDNNSASTSQDVSITLTGTNDEVLLTGLVTTGDVVEDGTASAVGTISFSDIDRIDVHIVTSTAVSSTSTTPMGSFSALITADTTGSGSGGLVTWSYTIDNAAAQQLAEGEVVTEVHRITVDDQNGDTSSQDVTIRITGTNDGPTITLLGTDAEGAVTEDASTPTLTDSGTINFNDIDLIDVHTASITAAVGNTLGGSLTLDPVSESSTTEPGSLGWSYSLANTATQFLADGQTTTESFTVTIDDGQGGTVDQLVTITITGTNDGPTITLLGTDAEGAVTEDASTPTLTDSGTINFNDIDLIDVHTASVTAAVGNTLGGSLTLDPVNESSTTEPGSLGWSYSLANSATQFLADGKTTTESFTVTIDDGQGGTVDQLVTITITGTNDGPELSDTTDPTPLVELADASAQDMAPISGSFALSDLDFGDTLTASVLAGPAVLLNGSAFTLPTGAETLLASGAFVITPTTQVSNGGSAAAISYTYDPGAADLDFLSATDSLTITYQVNVSDGLVDATQDVTFTITGTGEPLFTELADTVDFNTITLADYYPGTYSDALGGNDTVILLSGGKALPSLLSSFTGGAGNDSLTGSGTTIGLYNVDLIDGGADDDTIAGSGLSGLYNDATGTITGGTGHDSILGSSTGTGTGLYNDGAMAGGEGDNTIEGSNGSNGLYNGGSITNGTGNDRIAGDGVFYGVRNNGTIDSGDGSNTMAGSAGANGSGIENNGTIIGGSGDDLLTASGGFAGIDNNVSISTGAGNDTIAGSSSSIGINNKGLIHGGTDDDAITGFGLGSSSIHGGIYNHGSGTITGGAGNDSIVGSGVNDDYGIYNDSTINGGDGNDFITGSGGIRGIFNFGLIDGGTDDDAITAFGGTEGMSNEGTIVGGAGNDSVTATGGTTWGFFNSGTINLGSGNDVLTGSGATTASSGGMVNSSTGTIRMGEDTLAPGESDDDIINVLQGGFRSGGTILMGAGDDKFIGNGLSGTTPNLIDGGAGDDTLWLRSGISYIFTYNVSDSSYTIISGPSPSLGGLSTAMKVTGFETAYLTSDGITTLSGPLSLTGLSPLSLS